MQFASERAGASAVDANNFVTISGAQSPACWAIWCTARGPTCCFSAEFRRLPQFSPSIANASITNQINLAMGILF